MAAGNVIFACRDRMLSERLGNMLCLADCEIHAQKGVHLQDVIMIHSFMRADVIFLDMSLPEYADIHLIRELKRDVVNPYVMVLTSAGDEQAERRIRNAGADSVICPPLKIADVCREIEEQIRRRCGMNSAEAIMAEKMLQRIFMEYGIPCYLKGYHFLKAALGMLSGYPSKQAVSMSRIYEAIGARQGCSAGCVERSIRYVIDRCWSRSRFADLPRPGCGEFIAQILAECRSAQGGLLDPKISVYCSDRRVFR